MGGVDKALLPFAGRPLIARVVARLEPQVEALALSANGDPARFAALGLPVLADDTPLGPLAGILAALNWAAPLGATAVLSAPVDGPFLPGDLAPRLCLAAETAPKGLAIATADGRVHPTFGLWPVTLADDLARFLASGAKPKVMDFASAQGAAQASFSDARAFLNLNTPEDVRHAEDLMKGPS
jgi:molybdenum cofactor guanylyltransferase